MNFEWVLNAWIGNPSPVCVHARTCGQSVVIEHNGDVFACDHCVYPQYKLGNIMSDTLPDMVAKSLRSGFGVTKETALPRWCIECEVLPACQGGCPNIDFRQLITMSRGFSIFALDTRNSFFTFANICGPWPRCRKRPPCITRNGCDQGTVGDKVRRVTRVGCRVTSEERSVMGENNKSNR